MHSGRNFIFATIRCCCCCCCTFNLIYTMYSNCTFNSLKLNLTSNVMQTIQKPKRVKIRRKKWRSKKKVHNVVAVVTSTSSPSLSSSSSEDTNGENIGEYHTHTHTHISFQYIFNVHSAMKH